MSCWAGKKRDNAGAVVRARHRCETADTEDDSVSGVLQLSHPYGIKPGGNTFFNSAADCRASGLGDLCCLDDIVILAIFENLSAADLSRCASVSKAFYLFAQYDELWRSLVLAEFGGAFEFYESWKQTYQRMVMPGLLAEHRPLIVQGFCSDLLFRSWYCSSASLPSSWLSTDNIDRVSSKDLPLQLFIDKYEKANRPVLITDLVTSWPAHQSWSFDHFAKEYPSLPVSVGEVVMPMGQYLRYMFQINEDDPLYCFDKKFAANAPQLGKDYEVPEYFAEDLFQFLGEGSRPDYRWLIVGPQRSGSKFHIDPNGTSAWNAVIRGSKKWIFYPPGINPPGIHPSPDGADVTSPKTLMEWFLNFCDQTRHDNDEDEPPSRRPRRSIHPTPHQSLPRHRRGHDAHTRPIECVCREGELVFVPSGWWHVVLNLENSIAITQNYVSRRNLLSVLNFLRTRPEQVSGCSDQGASLARRFEDKINDVFPGELEKLTHAEQSNHRNHRATWKEVTNDAQDFKFSFSHS